LSLYMFSFSKHTLDADTSLKSEVIKYLSITALRRVQGCMYVYYLARATRNHHATCHVR